MKSGPNIKTLANKSMFNAIHYKMHLPTVDKKKAEPAEKDINENFRFFSDIPSNQICTGSTKAQPSILVAPVMQTSSDASLFQTIVDEDNVITGFIATTSSSNNDEYKKEEVAAAQAICEQVNDRLMVNKGKAASNQQELQEIIESTTKFLANEPLADFTDKPTFLPLTGAKLSAADTSTSLSAVIVTTNVEEKKQEIQCSIVNIGQNMIIHLDKNGTIKEVYGAKKFTSDEKNEVPAALQTLPFEANTDQLKSQLNYISKDIDEDDIIIQMTPGAYEEFKLDHSVVKTDANHPFTEYKIARKEFEAHLPEVKKPAKDSTAPILPLSPQEIAQKLYYSVISNTLNRRIPETNKYFGQSVTISVTQIPNQKLELVRALLNNPEQAQSLVYRLSMMENLDNAAKADIINRLENEKTLDRGTSKLGKTHNELNYTSIYSKDQLDAANFYMNLATKINEFAKDTNNNVDQRSLTQDLANHATRLMREIAKIKPGKYEKKEKNACVVVFMNNKATPLTLNQKDILSQLVHANITILNNHENPKTDKFFRRPKTKGFRKEFELVRREADKQLNEYVKALPTKQKQLTALEAERNKYLFAEKRHNWTLWSRTDSQKDIDKMINTLKKEIAKETAASSAPAPAANGNSHSGG